MTECLFACYLLYISMAFKYQFFFFFFFASPCPWTLCTLANCPVSGEGI